ncbi:MAG: sodium:solute symporter [Desulfobacterales bacterium]|jgi:SSS family solute:Na+ symporter
MPNFSLSIIDWIVLLLYFSFIIWRGIGYAKKHENAEDYFLAGRSLTWPLIGLSLYASNISSSSLIGMAASGYETGYSVFSYEWMAAVVLIIFAAFFLPFYLRSKIFTLPEFLEKRFDARSRYYFSALTVLTNIGVDTAATLYAGALVIQLILPSVNLWQIILILAIFSGLYTIAGGLKAVVYTDVIQAILLIFGSVLLTALAFLKIGDWEAVRAAAPAQHFHIIQPYNDAFLPWPGLFTGVFLLGFYFWATNQFIVQRTLGAKNLQHGQWGALFAGFLKVSTPLLIMIIPGMMARVLYPDIEKANYVFPVLMFDLLPKGLLGLVLAGLIAAMMSSIDSALNSASTLVTMDFIKKLRPQTTSVQLMWIGRTVTFVFMLAAAAWAPQIDKFPTLWQYLQSALSYIVPPIVALFMIGLFWKRANANGALAGIAMGIVAGAFFLIFRDLKWLAAIHFLYVAAIIFSLSCLSIFAVSLFTPPPPEKKVRDFTWQLKIYHSETIALGHLPVIRNYRYQSLLLIAFLVLMLLVFW